MGEHALPKNGDHVVLWTSEHRSPGIGVSTEHQERVSTWHQEWVSTEHLGWERTDHQGKLSSWDGVGTECKDGMLAASRV